MFSFNVTAGESIMNLGIIWLLHLRVGQIRWLMWVWGHSRIWWVLLGVVSRVHRWVWLWCVERLMLHMRWDLGSSHIRVGGQHVI